MESKKTNVDELIARLPEGYEAASRSTKALERKREFKSAVELIKLIFLYLTGGYSQIEMSVIASSMGIAEISDVAFLKKFSKCRVWLEWMVSQIAPAPIAEYVTPKSFEGYTLVALDASDVSEKGSTKRIFRLHYAIDLMKLCAVSFKLTSQRVGETLLNFSIKENWLILADRVYGTLTGIEHCLKAKANFVLRLKHGGFKLYDEHGSEFSLLDKLQDVRCDVAKDIEVYVQLATLGLTKLRICAIRIPDGKLERVDKRNRRKASKKQMTISHDALSMSHYVVVITALPMSISASDIVSLYRLRWQVEMHFKRLKSILDFGNIPLKKEESIYTWLNGKLLISLLIEQMLSEVAFSP
jgi:hypothetical protein